MDAFYAELESKSMDALWRGRLARNAANEPRAPYPPFRWRWSDIRPFMTRAGELVEPGPESERRVVQLLHPALGPIRSASHTLTANVQMVLPGEVAPAHRHTIAAIRFIIEGEAAITIVNGDASRGPRAYARLALARSREPFGRPDAVMDSFDRPLTVALRQVHFEQYPNAAQPLSKPLGDSSARFGSGHLRPVALAASPLLSYPWSESEPALQRLAAAGVIDPFDDIAFDYTNPLTGGHVMPTAVDPGACKSSRPSGRSPCLRSAAAAAASGKIPRGGRFLS